jgi:hypothetical protein
MRLLTLEMRLRLRLTPSWMRLLVAQVRMGLKMATTLLFQSPQTLLLIHLAIFQMKFLSLITVMKALRQGGGDLVASETNIRDFIAGQKIQHILKLVGICIGALLNP